MQEVRKQEPQPFVSSEGKVFPQGSVRPPRPYTAPYIQAFLQPIVSVRQQKVCLAEALLRGVEPDGRIRPPLDLFAEAARNDLSRELERSARRAAFAAFALLPKFQRPLLSLNTDLALICEGERGAERVAEEAAEGGIMPQQIALEILEFAVTSPLELGLFAKRARKLGFLLALDDVGAGHSNLARIPQLEPDILKIDRALVHGISDNYHRREVFRSLIALAHQIGTLAVAEGVEEERDVVTALSLGCDLFQGYYFGRPTDVRDHALLGSHANLHHVGSQFFAHAKEQLIERRAQQCRNEDALQELLRDLQGTTSRETFEPVLRDALSRVPYIEALYVLDESGQQVTDTILHANADSRGLFAPAEVHADQSLKQYFLMLNAGLDRYTSDPYLSSATGKFCITMSRFFASSAGTRFVLCCDLMVSSHARSASW